MFKDDLRTLIEVLDISQRAFAEAIGVPLRTLEDWLAGKRTPPEYVQDAVLNAGRKLL